jgi:uracil-DNA glycosylase
MQNSLFESVGAIEAGSVESLDSIESEIRRRMINSPQFERRSFVFGHGAPGSVVAVVGDSPGPPDLNSGIPFQGPVGEMLDRMLSSIGVSRKECYLTNVVKFICANDEITADWISFFAPFVHQELLVVRPKVVLTFGNNPTRVVLRTRQAISQMHGRFHDYHGIRVMPTFNPAYLLRDPMKKREAWYDLKQVREYLRTRPDA